MCKSIFSPCRIKIIKWGQQTRQYWTLYQPHNPSSRLLDSCDVPSNHSKSRRTAPPKHCHNTIGLSVWVGIFKSKVIELSSAVIINHNITHGRRHVCHHSATYTSSSLLATSSAASTSNKLHIFFILCSKLFVLYTTADCQLSASHTQYIIMSHPSLPQHYQHYPYHSSSLRKQIQDRTRQPVPHKQRSTNQTLHTNVSQ